MNKISLFPTLIFQHDFSQDPEFQLLKDICKQQKTAPHTLVSGAESSYINENGHGRLLDNMLLKGIRSRIQDAVNQYTQELGLEPAVITNSWFNKLSQGHRVERHRHECSVVSGALYLHADAGSVPLRLHNPINHLRMFEHIAQTTRENEQWFEFPCVTGMLVIFPSWLEHDTLPNQTDSRITLSFNSSYHTNKAIR
jgi:uncharacterized protein (TIGR02466 family)